MSQSDQPAGEQQDADNQPYGQPFGQPVPPTPQPTTPTGNSGQAPPPNQPPAAFGYQPAPGYPTNAPPRPTPLSPSDERLWGTLSFLLPIIVGFLGPLVIYLVYRERSQFVRATSRESLNLQITAAFVGVGAVFVLFGVGFVMAIALPPVGAIMFIAGFVAVIGYGIAVLIFEILGALKANSGEVYRVPFILRLVKN